MNKTFENFTITILKLNKLIQKIKLYEIKDYGLKSIHVMCIYYLNKYKDGITASNLAKLTLEDKAAISRALHLLKENDYTEYDSNKYNALIKLTKKGEIIAEYIEKKANKAVDEVEIFTNEERNTFYNSLESIYDNLKVYYEKIRNEE